MEATVIRAHVCLGNQYGVPVTAVNPAAGEALRHHSAVVWLPSLSGLRFGAVLLVFGFHVYAADVFTSGSIQILLGWLFGPGAGGVSLFFVLSGFVLTWSARPNGTARQFWWRRFVRIYPTHAATSLAALVGLAVAGAGVSAATVVPNLLLVQVWVPDHRVFFGLNAVSWFVACEAFFYAVFPLLHRALSRLPVRALWPGALILFAATWAIPLAAQPLPEATRYWIIWILPLARLPEFVVGMLLARIVREGQAPWLRVPPLAVVAAGAYFGSALLPAGLPPRRRHRDSARPPCRRARRRRRDEGPRSRLRHRRPFDRQRRGRR